MENKILELLDRKKNVILMGAPGTGKSRLINQVAEAFETKNGVIETPSHQIGASVPIPASKKSGVGASFMNKKNRKVFRTTLHQNSKYRDFLTGIVPTVDVTGGFEICEGILYRANEYAKQDDSAALLIIDELNRGPAIEVFGGSIVAIESDKRLASDNTVSTTTQSFEITDPSSGKMIEYAFSSNLYILAAMNQADVSVAPLDVAFLRRWQPVKLMPDYSALENRFKFNMSDSLPASATSSNDVFLAVAKALKKINEKIIVGRGEDYQLGHGVVLSTEPKDNSLDSALEFACEVWDMIFAHIEELFFGDVEAVAFIVNADSDLSPYNVSDEIFAGETKTIMKKPIINKSNIFNLYKAIEEC